MAHKKAGGSKAKQKGNVAGKRLGFKISGGSAIKTGQIIVRQRGSKFHGGVGVGVGRDHTLFAKTDGSVQIKTKLGKAVVEVR
ncbi:MAG: 50S ribosomal protein L27 [bacterium]|nr:50S ribosomal protein L27 [bacterium]